MKKIAWLTDIHLDFVDPTSERRLLSTVRGVNPDGILLSGDIGEAPNVVRHLCRLDDAWQRPLFVVLGNHDFYRGSIAQVRSEMAELCQLRPNIVYLTQSPPRDVSPRVGLVGHDGWADAREGDYHRSLVMMNDYLLIEELAGCSKAQRLEHLYRLGDEAAEGLSENLRVALDRFEHVIALTHVPPFREACWYEGQISDDEWAPHFVCQAMGRRILDLAALFPHRTITVLCGHTHSPGECRPAANVHVITGGAEYGQPQITRIFEFV